MEETELMMERIRELEAEVKTLRGAVQPVSVGLAVKGGHVIASMHLKWAAMTDTGVELFHQPVPGVDGVMHPWPEAPPVPHVVT